jgi:hypothetical protein
MKPMGYLGLLAVPVVLPVGLVLVGLGRLGRVMAEWSLGLASDFARRVP